jgi:hypothetical protein
MLLLIIIVWITFAGYGYWVATVKRRHPGEGLFLGLLLGPVGVIVEASLRERTAEEVEAERTRRREEAQARAVEEQEHQAALQAEALRRRRESQARSEAARAIRAEALGRLSEWFDRVILRFGWYKALPETAQPIAIGLMIAIPLVVLLILLLRGK